MKQSINPTLVSLNHVNCLKNPFINMIILFALFGFSASECPDTWWSLGRFCYHISQHQLDWGVLEWQVMVGFWGLWRIFLITRCFLTDVVMSPRLDIKGPSSPHSSTCDQVCMRGICSASNCSTYDHWHLIRSPYVAILKKLSSI